MKFSNCQSESRGQSDPVRIDLAPTSFAQTQFASVCRRRLAVVLSRYTDLVSEVLVRPAEHEGCRIEVVFGAGGSVSVVQERIGDLASINYLVDRVGRAVARRVDLGTNLAT